MTDQNLDQLPPQDLDAERTVLGTMMESKRAAADAGDCLSGEHFYSPKHGVLFEVILGLYASGDPVDHVTIVDRLMRDGLIGKIDAGYVHTCQQAARPDVTYYAEIVLERYRQRRFLEAVTHGVQLAWSAAAGADTDEMIDRVRGALEHVAEDGRKVVDVSFGDAMWDYIEEMDGEDTPAIKTGIKELDEQLLGGLRPGQLIVVGARPGVGKSVFGVNVATAVAEAGYGVFFASLEMSRNELMHRVFASVGSIPMNRLAERKLTEEDRKRRKLVTTRAANWALKIDDNPNQTLASIRSEARSLKRTNKGLQVLVLDYLQLLSGSGKKHDRRDLEIAENTRGLKKLAKELGITIIALCQVGRGAEARADKRPGMTDLRESGSIENDADIVILLHRDLLDPQLADHIEAIVAKHRGGPTGVLDLFWGGAYQRITGTEPRLRSVV